MHVRTVGALLLVISAVVCIPLHLMAAGEDKSAQVSFTLDFPAANPSHYQIVVASSGSGSYSSNGKLSEDSAAADEKPVQFTVPEGLEKQIFDLARRAHYFQDKVDSGRKGIANTGEKTLAYTDQQHHSQATYNDSLAQPIEELTSLFENLSTTMEFGRRLTFFHKYQKLAIDDELKRMGELQQENMLGDVQVIAPVLQSIADDPSVMNVSRARALRLLHSAGK
jgi:hypothetical protein